MSAGGEAPAGPSIPRATYRLQLNRDFTFADAARLVPYLDALGVSHLYLSPFLEARAGSPHGYDITDHNALNPELGGREAFERLAEALSARRMGQILDFVPNHMGVGRADNAWWLDVLEWGEASPFARYFDIDWRPAKAALRGKVLLPFLGSEYGAALVNGELTLVFEPAAGSFAVRYYDHRFPIAPRHYARILDRAAAELRGDGEGEDGAARLESLAGEFRGLRAARAGARRRAQMRERAAALKDQLAGLAARNARVRAGVGQALEQFNGTPGAPQSFVQLHRLLEAQAYRLAFWKVAADEINYRRFFDINDLAGLRIEIPEVFEATHRLVFRLIGERKLHGLRIDHIDGLFDPERYVRRLQTRAGELLGPAPEALAGPAGGPLYVLVEKILAQHEFPRESWPVAGTTGYEVLNLINGLFVDPQGERTLDRLYRRFCGREAGFDEVLYRSKRFVMANLLASELQVLANELSRIAESNWRTRDFTLNGLRAALMEVVARFPVYRTYVGSQGPNEADRRDIEWAVAQARKSGVGPGARYYHFIREVLTTDLVRRRPGGYNRREVVRFAMKFQQYTAPVMAKGLEDTGFYRYNRLVSLNEVGGDPRRFAVSPAAFHHLTAERARRWPFAMVSTGTHDTKRGEDVRVRIDALSELAAEWSLHVRRWARSNWRHKRLVEDTPAPTPNQEYLLYQTLVGSWPPEAADPSEEAGGPAPAYVERVVAYMIKAAREAKTVSGWADPNEPYEESLAGFVRRILDPSPANPFLADIAAFAARVARIGMVNGLAQALLKLAMPGVPDIYQGAELWDLSLVDPDNRRPVDYARRARVLDELRAGADPAGHAPPGLLEALLGGWPDGRVKLYLVWRLLALRRQMPALFLEGGFVPLAAEGARADHLCAFAREQGGRCLVVAVPRLVGRLMGQDGALPLGDVWGDTVLLAPAEAPRPYENILTGEQVTPAAAEGGAAIPAADLFARFPVAALLARGDAE